MYAIIYRKRKEFDGSPLLFTKVIETSAPAMLDRYPYYQVHSYYAHKLEADLNAVALEMAYEMSGKMPEYVIAFSRINLDVAIIHILPWRKVAFIDAFKWKPATWVSSEEEALALIRDSTPEPVTKIVRINMIGE